MCVCCREEEKRERGRESIESGLRDITVDFPKVLYSANTLCLREPLTENEYWK